MNFSIFLAIVTIWAVKICSSQPVSKRSNTTVIRPGDYPYQGVIRLFFGDEIFLLCEFAIIDEKWILTAAGCVDKYESNQENLDVVAGITSTQNIKSEPHAQVRKISRINISPLWVDSKKKTGDLALIELLKPFTFNKFVNKAIFGKNATVNETAQLVGYGVSENLTLIELEIISKQECNLETSNNTAELICARKNSSRYAFNDESFAGAPLVTFTYSDSSRDEVVGIVSAKWHFTSVAHHKNWIENVAKIKSSNAEDTSASTTPEESYASDGSNNTENETTTTSTTPFDDYISDESSESSEETKNTTTSTTPSNDYFSDESSESSEETKNTTTSTTPSDDYFSDESTEPSEEAENSSDENSGETTTTEDTLEDSTESPTTESQPTTATTSFPNTAQTSAPTSTTTVTSSTTTNPKTTTITTYKTTISSTTSTPTSQPTSSTPTTSTTTPTTSSMEDYYDYDDSTSHNRDQNFDKDNNNNKINPNDSAGSYAVTSNSAQPSNPSLISTMISTMISKTNNLFNSIKKFKIFFTVQ